MVFLLPECAVWQELSEDLSGLSSLYRSESFYGEFKTFVRNVYSRQMGRLGWEASGNESSRTGTLRPTVLTMMGISGDEAVLEEAYNRFCAFQDDPYRILSTATCASQYSLSRCSTMKAQFFSALKQIYERSTFPEEQRTCLVVMGRAKDPDRHAEVYQYVLFSGKVRMQDVAFPLNSLSGTTDLGGQVCWQILQDKFDMIHTKFGSSPRWGSIVGLSCRGLRTIEEAGDVESFFNDSAHQPGSAARRLSQALETVRTRAARIERDRSEVCQFFRKLQA